MKKLLSILLAVATLTMLIVAAIPAEARSSFAPNGTGWDPNEIVTVKKADPANVVKDGVIGDGEYERYYPDLDAEDQMTSPLFLVAFGADSLDHVLAMFPTMEYYFSWDEVHGFNFAIRNKPVEIKQVLTVLDGESPQDDFCRGLAYIINFDTENEEHPILYYALGKRTDTGEYLEGYYVNPNGPTQLGAKNTFNPEPGTNYIISYDYNTGYAMIEWSVPFDDIHVDPIGAGSKIKATLTATAGSAETPNVEHEAEDSYAVTLGDFGYGVNVKMMHNHVTYQLSDEVIEKTGSSPAPDPDPDPNPDNPGGGSGNTPAGPSNDQGQQVVIDPDQYEVTTDDEGNEIIVDKETGETVDVNTLPVAPAKTGDPMIIMAAVATFSAAGAVIVRRRRSK